METEKRICASCGAELKEGSLFCTNCGTQYVEEKKKGRPKKEETPAEPSIDVEALKQEMRNEFLKEIKESEAKQTSEIKASEQGVTAFKTKLKIYPILSCFVTLILCLIAFGLFYNYYMKNLVIETTKTVKEVTVNDKGISDAVEKVYDATVVVESYVRGQLYATGSGFVYKADGNYGYILTNDHVISKATEVKVLFSNNKRATVKVIGSDSYSDVGVLRVEKDKVVAIAEIGSTDKLKVGDTAFAVGAPLDSSTYGWTVTRGIISGKNRAVEVGATNSRASSVMEVLQTDTAINSGNSGGPLCNSNGEVIGITNMKLASAQIEGMGFAIPIEIAMRNAEKLIAGGKVTYPYLGVTLLDREDGGAIVESVEAKSPAEKGGLEKGDIILKIDGKEVTNSSFLKYNLYKHEVGDKIKLTVLRDGREKIIEITLSSDGPKA